MVGTRLEIDKFIGVIVLFLFQKRNFCLSLCMYMKKRNIIGEIFSLFILLVEIMMMRCSSHDDFLLSMGSFIFSQKAMAVEV